MRTKNMECIGWGASINCCIKFNYKGRHAVRVRTKQIMIRMCENTDHVGMKGGMHRKTGHQYLPTRSKYK